MESTTTVGHDHSYGYSVAYEREELQFPVYVVAVVAAGLATGGVVLDNLPLIALSLIAFGYAYHNYPLLETGRPRIGASQYGIFADGLGIISWRSIKQMEMVWTEIRGSGSHELLITLQEPIGRALLTDWRKRPLHRFLMRLPWTMAAKDVVRIPLGVFDRPADDIHRTFMRMMSFYRR